MALRLGDLLCCPYRTTVEVHQTPLRRRMGKDHTAAAPIAGGMRPGTRRRIAHTVLLRQGQGNAALLQVHFATAVWQSCLEGSELLGQVGTGWSRLHVVALGVPLRAWLVVANVGLDMS